MCIVQPPPPAPSPPPPPAQMHISNFPPHLINGAGSIFCFFEGLESNYDSMLYQMNLSNALESVEKMIVIN